MERLTDEEIMQELDDIWVFGEEPTDRQRIAANQAIHLIKELAELKEIRTLKKPTNGDYIRSMSDEDLANLINDPNTYGFNCGMCPLNPPYGECVLGNCHEQILDWLKQEREDKE